MWYNKRDLTLKDGRTVLFPIEFQGRRTYRAMPLRLLDYLSRITVNENPDILVSVVIYIGHRAGANDTGQHDSVGKHHLLPGPLRLCAFV
jgi:hypothetical protein